MCMRWAAPFAALAGVSAMAAPGGETLTLGGGVTATLAGDWAVQSFENPAMKIPAMRDMIADARETRARGGATVVLVSYMNIRPGKNATAPTPDMVRTEQESTVRKIAAQYLPTAVETEAVIEQRTNGTLSVALVTMHAAEGKTFRVAVDAPGGCITTGSIRRGAEAWAISVASKSCDAASHRMAVDALMAAQAG